MNCKKCSHIRIDVQPNTSGQIEPYKYYCEKHCFSSISSTSENGASGIFNGYVYYTESQLKKRQRTTRFCNSRYWLEVKDIITLLFSLFALIISILAYYKDSSKNQQVNSNKEKIENSEVDNKAIGCKDSTLITEKQGITFRS
jgi:hypothetical protein